MSSSSKLSKLKQVKTTTSSSAKNNGNRSNEGSTQISKFFSKPNNEHSQQTQITNETNKEKKEESYGLRKRKIIEPPEKRCVENSTEHGAADQSKTSKKLSKRTKTTEVPMISRFFNSNKNLDESLNDFDLTEKPKSRSVAPRVHVPPAKQTIKRKKTASSKRSTKGQTDIRKIINRNLTEDQLFSNVLLGHSSAEQINPDELQMALALSKSMIDLPENTDNYALGEELRMKLMNRKGLSCDDKQVIVRQTLEKFGFNPNEKKVVDYDFNQFFGLTKSKKQKWSSKCTQLTRRNPQQQNEKFRKRIERMLNSTKNEPKLFDDVIRSYSMSSQFLSKFYVPDTILFSLNSLDLDVTLSNYYTNNLFEPSTVKCGCLLKDWSCIPGRDVSPERISSSLAYLNNNVDKSDLEDKKGGVASADKCSSSSLNSTEVNSESKKEVSPVAHMNSVDESNKKFSLSSSNNAELESKSISTVGGDNLTSLKIAEDVQSSSQIVSEQNLISYSPQKEMTPQKDNNYYCKGSPDLFSDCEDDFQFEEPIQNSHIEDDVQKASHVEEDVDIIKVFSNENTPNISKANDLNVSTIINSSNELIDNQIMMNENLSKAKDLNVSTVTNSSNEFVENEICVLEKFTSGSEGDVKSGGNNSLSKYRKDEIEVEKNALNVSIIEIVSSGSSKDENEDIEGKINQDAIELEYNSANEMNSISLEGDIQNLCQERQSQNENENLKINYTNSQESIVISDDEINYSMNYDQNYDFDLNHLSSEHRLSSCGKIDEFIDLSQDSDSGKESDLQTLHQVFDETIGTGNSNNTSQLKCSQSGHEEKMLDQSIKDIMTKEFSLCTKTPTSIDGSIVKFKRTVSDLRPRESNRCLKFVEFLDDTMVYDKVPFLLHANIDDDASPDEFDLMVAGPSTNLQQDPIISPTFSLSLSRSFSSLSKSPETIHSPQTMDHKQFEIINSDREFLIKTGNVTPKPDYENMNSPTRLEHLKMYGLKPLTKRKAIICLEHIYNRLHPFIEIEKNSNDLFGNQEPGEPIDVKKTTTKVLMEKEKSEIYFEFNAEKSNLIAGNFDVFNNFDKKWFLPSAPRTKKPWCLEPLHIAWYNLIAANESFHESILQYKPLELMKVRKFFKEIGLLYDMNDLIAFLDCYCITFRTENDRNNRSSGKKSQSKPKKKN